MQRRELEQLIALGEGHTLEFKRANSSGLGRELCALANAQGGHVLIGVDDHGQIQPLRETNKLKSEIQSIARSMDPPLGLSVELVAGVLVIEIAPQRGKPFSFAGKFYLREGASSQQLGRNEIKQFFFIESLFWHRLGRVGCCCVHFCF